MVGLYVGAAKLGIELSVAHGVITPVWAPTGIALAALVLFGPRFALAVALGALIANATSGASLSEALFISVGNTLEALVGRELLVRAGFRPSLGRVRDVLALVFLAACVSTTVAATNGVTTLWVGGDVSGSSYGSEWLLYWAGDAMGDLIVAPLILVWATLPRRRPTRPEAIEGLVVLALLAGVSSFVFLAGYWRYPHLLFPILVWGVLRFRQRGAVTASFVVSGIAVAGAVAGQTPLGTGSATEVVQILEGLLAGIAVALLLVGAVLAERDSAVVLLAEAQEVAHLGSWEWDMAADRVTWSDELYRIYGLEPQSLEITYERYLERIHPDDRGQAKAIVAHAAATGSSFVFEHRTVLDDGRVRWLQGRGRVLLNDAGKPVRMVGTSQDVTERKQLDELRDTILSTVSHELRTPLTSIIGFAITLRERGRTLEPAIYNEIVDHLADQSGRLQALLGDLLDLDRLRLGLMQPTFRLTDVGELVERVVNGRQADSRRVELDAGRIVAEVDAPKVERIVENLIVNAVKHTPPEAPISVRVESEDGGVLISVDDRGPGVAAGDRDAIFKLFQRGDRVSGVPGAGVGLALVSQFAALHGGRAWVEENPGGGASFRVLLPARR
ncbi:MAG TPA: MASE1 domain-containing protein [Gaiellaceae bacterium]|nr:MASE1 domain-containing protein [Gaiellaceae bacterium]